MTPRKPHHRAKLTDAQVREIKAQPRRAPMCWIKLTARRFGVSPYTIHDIRYGKARTKVEVVAI